MFLEHDGTLSPIQDMYVQFTLCNVLFCAN